MYHVTLSSPAPDRHCTLALIKSMSATATATSMSPAQDQRWDGPENEGCVSPTQKKPAKTLDVSVAEGNVKKAEQVVQELAVKLRKAKRAARKERDWLKSTQPWLKILETRLVTAKIRLETEQLRLKTEQLKLECTEIIAQMESRKTPKQREIEAATAYAIALIDERVRAMGQ